MDRSQHNPGPLQGWTPAAEQALAPLRAAMAERILDALAALTPLRGRILLDVGCAAGWFLRAAAARGIEAHGIEPDPAMAARASVGAATLIAGPFPDAIPASAHYDIVSFNDVLEHLADPDAALAAAWHHTSAGAMLVCTVPDSAGILYRIARLAARCRWPQPFERCWQRGYQSPHRWYFTACTLEALAVRHGFDRVRVLALPGYRMRGAWQRLRASFGVPLAAGAWLLLAVLCPLRWALAADSVVFLFRRRS